MKSVVVASAMLVALCSAADARAVVHHPRMASESAMQMSEAHPASTGFAAPTEDMGNEAHVYHGGPKVND